MSWKRFILRETGDFVAINISFSSTYLKEEITKFEFCEDPTI